MFSLTGKTAVATGGGSGIGKAISKLFAKQGAIVHIIELNADAAQQTIEEIGNVKYYNFMNTEELENTFNESEVVLCRSGYTTIMDLAQLGKKAFFIPTPGQYEQEYLAKKLKKEGLVPFARQNDFKIENLNQIEMFKGLKNFGTDITWNKLFCLFEGK